MCWDTDSAGLPCLVSTQLTPPTTECFSVGFGTRPGEVMVAGGAVQHLARAGEMFQ